MKRGVESLLPPDAVAAGRVVSCIGMALTDLGNAERLVARYRDRIRYCPPRKQWLVWDGKRWRWDETGQIRRYAKKTVRAGYSEAEHGMSDEAAKAIAKHFTKSEDVARVEAMIKHASTEEGIPVMPGDLDADPWLLNCDNGTLDLRTGELREHRRADLITRIVPIAYDPTAKSELWERFLDDATGGDAELRAFLPRLAGYCATADTTEKHFFFVYSRKPDTGKSTFADAIRGALGEYAQDADFDTWLEQSGTGGNRGDIARLAGARLVISVEVRKRAKFDSKLVKAITGGDPVTCAAKYEKEFTFKPGFKILLAANAAPVIHDDDRPLFERCLRVPFDAQIPAGKKDKTVKERLSDPGDAGGAILAWIVQGCLDWQRNGLGVPDAVKRSSEAYRSEMDRFNSFVTDGYELGTAARISKGDFKEAYLAWCRDNDIKHPLPAKEIKARLEEMGVHESKSGSTRYWVGLSAKDADRDNWDSRGSVSQNFSTREQEEKVPENNVSPVPCVPEDDDEQAEREAIEGEPAARGNCNPETEPFDFLSPEGV